MDWLVTNIVLVLAIAGAVFLLGLAIGALEVFPRWPSRKRWGLAFWLVFLGAVAVFGTLQSGPGGKTPKPRDVDPNLKIDLTASHLDRLRADWDASGDPRWPVAETLVTLCQIAYDGPVFATEGCSKLGLKQCFTITDGSMVGYVVAQDDAVVIVFRGTDMHEWSDWGVNKSIRSARTEHGDIHSGFDQAYEKLAPQVEKLLSQLRPKHLWVTGHSLGGALATVCAYRIESQGDHEVKGLITFGQPMIARLDLAEHLDSVFKDRYAWVVNGSDMIPKTPPRYEPAGRLVHLNGTKSPGYWRRGEVFATAMPGDDGRPRASIQAPPLPPLTPDERELLKNQLRKEPPPMFETETLAYTSYVPEVSDHFMDAYLLSLRDLLGADSE